MSPPPSLDKGAYDTGSEVVSGLPAPRRGIRILIIHTNRLFREGLAIVLGQQPNVTVVSTAECATEILGELNALQPTIAILDLCLPGREGLGEARLIHSSYKEAKILMLGLTDLESDVLAAIEAGAAGYLPKEASIEDLRRHIRAVASGEALVSPKVAAVLFSRVADAANKRDVRRALGLPNLTRRELEIVGLIEQGLSNKEIAVRLRIELPTVKNHVHKILDKLQLDGRREAARFARERGIIASAR